MVATIVVILRLWCRRLARLPFWWDDFVIVIALILAYGATVLGTLTTAYGMGHHVVTVIKTYPQLAKVRKERIDPPPNTAEMGLRTLADRRPNPQAQYGSAITYPMQLAATKVAILLMYRRIFPVSSFRHGLRKMGFYSVAWYIILFLVVGYGISFTFSIIFTCLPIYSLWTIPLPANTKCNHQSAQWLSIALNITNDLLILSLPIGKILGLKLKKSQKVVLSGIFMLGGFVLFASIVRLYYITKAINLKGETTPPQIAPSPYFSPLRAGSRSHDQVADTYPYTCRPNLGSPHHHHLDPPRDLCRHHLCLPARHAPTR